MTKLTVNTAATAQQMAEAMFGQGVTIISATYTGDVQSSGTYADGKTISPNAVPADTGVILSTGKAVDFTSGDAANYNVRNNTSTNTSGVDGDADLSGLVGRTVYDASIFEAEFTSTGDTMSMQLIFGSEEYLEWVDSGFNDVVGIWINGVKAEMTIGEGDISIDNINTASNANLFRDNANDAFNTEMDGITKVLTVKAPVSTTGVNTIKIGIADDGDSVYDSNLLIVGDFIQTAVIANDDTVSLTRNETKVFDLLANDLVPEGETISVIKIDDVEVSHGETVTLKTGETLTLNDDCTVTITAAPNTASNTLNYTITSESGTSDVAFLTIVTSPIDGTEGNDSMLVGYTDADGNMIEGTDGNDDVIFGYGGNDKIFAESGDDEIHGGSGNDFIRAHDGDDKIFGGTGNDVLDGGTGADTMEGGAGNDIYYIDNAGDVISEAGGDGHDKVHSTLTHTLADGFEDLWLKGSDAISGTGNAARNMIVGNNQANVIDGQDGNDNLIGQGGHDTIRGGEGNDKLHGGNGKDELYGDAGNDKLHGGFGDDVVYGGIGNDTLCPGAGDDTMFGGEGNDLLSGNAGADVAYGGLGNDTYKVTDALDTIVEYAGEGTDVVHASVSFTLGDHVENLRLMGNGDISATGNDDANRLNGNGGNNAMDGQGGNDHMNGRGGNDSMAGGAGNDRMNGNAGDDTLDGGADNDHLTGGAGADELLGGAGNDRLFGGAGADVLTGGAGDDVLKGDAGEDVFVFAAGAGDDKIRGFDADDTLRFEGLSADDLTVTAHRNGTLIEYGNDDSILIVNAHGIDADDFSFV